MTPDEAYEKLRATVESYSEVLDDQDVYGFAYDLHLIPGTNVSADPGLRMTFFQRFPPETSPRDAYAIAATFVEDELVKLRRAKAGERIVDDLRAAAAGIVAPDAPLLPW